MLKGKALNKDYEPFLHPKLEDLSPQDQELLRVAMKTHRNAYAPYSRFGVGAAVRSISGHLYSGSNMENASYGLTACAEMAALTRAVTDGDFRVEAIAIVGGSLGEATSSSKPVTPCGRCRQLIAEAGEVSGTDVRVLCANADLSRVMVTTISSLLPLAFGPKDLGVL